MPTFDVLVSDELLPRFVNSNPLLPKHLHVHGPTAEQHHAAYGMTRLRMTDGAAPAWTEGKLVDLAFKASYEPTGVVQRVWIDSYIANVLMPETWSEEW